MWRSMNSMRVSDLWATPWLIGGITAILQSENTTQPEEMGICASCDHLQGVKSDKGNRNPLIANK